MTNRRRKNESVQKLVLTAIFAALIIIMSFTPLGYLKAGPVSITFITLPVVIGAILCGPGVGALLGAVFGITSLIQCFGIDPFGTTLFSINAFWTVILCIVPRLLMGLFCGLIFKGLSKTCKNSIMAYGITSISGGVLNTVLFVGLLIAFFGKSEYLHSFGASLPAIISALITFNAVIEWVVCLILGTAISKAIAAAIKKYN